MTSLTSGSTTTTYAYRADGMRVSKDDATASSRFYYDGQMPMETLDVDGSSSTVTRNGLGARGVDRIERVNTSGTTVGYPLYDAHGNMIATLAKSGASYALGDQRTYDAWGVIRSGPTSGDPKGRHCANLGHVADDESGFIYMRARYYDPSTVRFMNEDYGKQGLDWFTYCGNDPINRFDQTGKSWDDVKDIALIIGGIMASKSALFFTLALIFSGLVAFTSCCTCGLGFIAAAGCFGWGLIKTGQIITDTIKSSGFWPKIFITKDPFDIEVHTNGLGEALGFLTTYYSVLDLLFRHVDDLG